VLFCAAYACRPTFTFILQLACSQTPSDMWRQLLDVSSLAKLRLEDVEGAAAAAAGGGGGFRGGLGQGGSNERRRRRRQAELQVSRVRTQGSVYRQQQRQQCAAQASSAGRLLELQVRRQQHEAYLRQQQRQW
jgi:hypothetical protein